MFIKFFLQLQNTIRVYHWTTKSYARHKATDELYERIEKNVDKFVEVYSGKHGRINLQKKDVVLNIELLTDATAPEYLKQSIHFLLNDITKGLNKNDVDLMNIRDEIIADLNQALYLFTLS